MFNENFTWIKIGNKAYLYLKKDSHTKSFVTYELEPILLYIILSLSLGHFYKVIMYPLFYFDSFFICLKKEKYRRNCDISYM